MKCQYLLLLLTLNLTSCHSQEVKSEESKQESDLLISTIDISGKQIVDELPLVEMVDQQLSIFLESINDVVVGKIDKVLLHDSLLYILDRQKAESVFVFDFNGHFIRKIGRKGRGPGMFREPEDIVLDRTNNEIGILERSGVLWYNLSDGSFLRKTKLKNLLFERIAYLGDSKLIGYANNQCGLKKKCYNFHIFDKEGVIQKSMMPVARNERNVFIEYQTPFSSFAGEFSISHLFNDTIFFLSPSQELKPKFFVNFNEMSLKDRSRLPQRTADIGKWINYSHSNSKVSGFEFVYETSNVLLLQSLVGHQMINCFYFKESKSYVAAKSLNLDRLLTDGLFKGSSKEFFIGSLSGEYLYSLKDRFEAYENQEEIKDYWGSEFYDYVINLKITPNPAIILTSFKKPDYE